MKEVPRVGLGVCSGLLCIARVRSKVANSLRERIAVVNTVEDAMSYDYPHI